MNHKSLGQAEALPVGLCALGLWAPGLISVISTSTFKDEVLSDYKFLSIQKAHNSNLGKQPRHFQELVHIEPDVLRPLHSISIARPLFIKEDKEILFYQQAGKNSQTTPFPWPSGQKV